MGKEHLQFDIKETRALFRDVYGLDIGEEEIERVAELSEGWVTVIQLILQRLSVVDGISVDDALNNYIASGEDLFDYFANEVFNYQSRTVRDFLMKTSILEYLEPKVCDHVLRIRGSEKIVGHLECEHIFVLRAGDRLFYHPLFKEFLYKRLADSYSAQYVTKLHGLAGEYFYKRGEYSAAVSHLVGARRFRSDCCG